MKWKRFLLISISVSLLLFSKQIIRACAGMYHDFYSNTVFFGNSTPEQPAYTPFKFTMYREYYGDPWQNPSSTEVVNKQLILKEWVNFFDHRFSKKEIESLLYHEAPTNIFRQIKTGKNIAIDNAFSRYLQKHKDRPVLDYLIYAKDCEVNANKRTQQWPEEKTAPTKSNGALKQEGLRIYKTVDHPFLQMKYAFQILRMAFYNQDYKEVLSLYKKLIGHKRDHSVAFTRLLGFKAGAYYHLGLKEKAGYYYTKMFANSDAYKYSALKSFQWSVSGNSPRQTRNHFKAIYNLLCQNDQERAISLEMKVLHKPTLALEELQKIYALYPQIKGLEVLINREVNKLEYYYFSKKVSAQNKVLSKLPKNNISYYYKPAENLKKLNEKFLPYIERFQQFLNRLIKTQQTESTAFWYLTKAYLAIMQQEPQKVQQTLASAKRQEQSPKEKALYQRLKLLHLLYKTPKITTQVEKKLLPQLKALENLAKQETNKNFAKQQFKNLMSNILAGRYFAQGDTLKGIYAMAHSLLRQDYKSKEKYFYVSPGFSDKPGILLNHMTTAELKKLIQYRKKPSKSDFEQWLLHPTYYTAKVLKELLATKYIRQQKFKLAAKTLKNTSIDETYTDPFMPQINDYLQPRNDGQKYTKFHYSKRMAELQAIIAQNPEDAGALYGYAVALYNTSYYGQAWHLTAYYRGSTDSRAYFKRPQIDKKMPTYLEEYYRLYKAEQYFNKTFKAAKDPVLKAKALWGAAKCWQKRTPLTPDDLGKFEKKYHYVYRWNHQKEYYQHALKNPYFDRLKTQYLKTDFVHRVKRTCDYFSDYL